MADQLEPKELWLALSDLFVDAKVDYKQIAEVAKKYSLEEIEFALFERVAPVCIGNMLAPVPPIWWYFEKEQLIADIESLIKKRARQGMFGKCLHVLTRRWIRLISSDVWAQLKAEVELVRSKE